MHSMPSWFGRRPQAAPIASAHSYHTAPGWRLYGKPVYTCIEPVQGPAVDPDVLNAIREFDPDVVPIWQVQAWMPPGKMGVDSVVRIAHVGLARRVRDPRGACMLPKVEMPPGSVDAPNTLEFIWTDMNNVPKDGGPRDVWPFDWKLYYECRATFNSNQSNKAVIKSVLDRQDIEDARAQTQLDEELAYRKKRLDKAIARRLDGVTPKELMDQYMLSRQRGSARERKLYAFHGRSS